MSFQKSKNKKNTISVFDTWREPEKKPEESHSK